MKMKPITGAMERHSVWRWFTSAWSRNIRHIKRKSTYKNERINFHNQIMISSSLYFITIPSSFFDINRVYIEAATSTALKSAKKNMPLKWNIHCNHISSIRFVHSTFLYWLLFDFKGKSINRHKLTRICSTCAASVCTKTHEPKLSRTKLFVCVKNKKISLFMLVSFSFAGVRFRLLHTPPLRFVYAPLSLCALLLYGAHVTFIQFYGALFALTRVQYIFESVRQYTAVVFHEERCAPINYFHCELWKTHKMIRWCYFIHRSCLLLAIGICDHCLHSVLAAT